MTDLDPLRRPPDESAALPDRVAREPGGRPSAPPGPGMDGPTGHALTTERVGDPEGPPMEPPPETPDPRPASDEEGA